MLPIDIPAHQPNLFFQSQRNILSEHYFSARPGGLVNCAENLYHINSLLRLEARLGALNDHIVEVPEVSRVLSVGSVVSRDNIEALAVFLGVELDLAVLPIESRLRAAKLDKACLFLDVRCPAELYLELRPVIEAVSYTHLTLPTNSLV